MLARRERRSANQMAEILIEEALAARGVSLEYDKTAHPRDLIPADRPMCAEQQQCRDCREIIGWDVAYCPMCGNSQEERV